MKILVLQEGKYQGQTGYHFTTLDSALKIVKSDLMKATNSATSTGKWKDMEKSKSWSITRNKGGIKYRNFNKNSVRFDIDLWKLSNNQKIKGSYVDSSSYAPIQYDWKGNVDPNAIDFEYEMRPLGNTNNFHKCVKSISICLESYNYKIISNVMSFLASSNDILNNLEEELKIKYPELMKAVDICSDESKFKKFLIDNIDEVLGNNSIDFKDYISSDLFVFNYVQLMKDYKLALKTITSLTQVKEISLDIKDESEFNEKIRKIILDNDMGDFTDLMKLLSKGKWKNIPIVFVDTKGVKLSQKYKKEKVSIDLDYYNFDIYQKLVNFNKIYFSVLRKYIWQYLERKKGIALLRDMNSEDSFVRLYDSNSKKIVYVPASDKDDIKEIKLILRKGNHGSLELKGNELYSSKEIIKNELVSVFNSYGTLKKKVLFYVADSLNLKKFSAFSIAPGEMVKGITPFVLSVANKKL